MSSCYAITETTAFTVTHAKHLAAKVVTDLKRMQRFYRDPSDSLIDGYEDEIVQLLKYGFLERASYGFQENGSWVEPTLIYTARELDSTTNDDPGKIRPGRDVSNADFYSFLEYSSGWFALSEVEKLRFKQDLVIQRVSADQPGINGYLEGDRTYSSGGRTLSRASVRSK